MAAHSSNTRLRAAHPTTLLERAALALAGLGTTWFIIMLVNLVALARGF
jgi:hypothetical protein